MKKNDFNDILLTEIRELKSEIRDVRQTDIPGIHTRIALMEEKVSNLRDKVTKDADRKAKIYGGVGGALAIIIQIVMSHLRH